MGRGSRRKMEIWMETSIMKLTTKMIKQIIREEIEDAKKEEVTQEAFEHLADLTPEQVVMLKDGIMNLIQIAGSATGLMIAMTKVAEEIGKMKKDKEEGK